MPLPTWIQGHQLRGKKRWVKKHFSFGENFYLTLPKLSFDESNCQSYSASHSFVCSSRCLNPLLSILLSYPSVWLSGWLSRRAFFLPNSHSFVQNHFITYELVLFPTVRWIQKTPSTVCFGARDDLYGFFWTSKAGNIITFKLTHKSGYVTCHSTFIFPLHLFIQWLASRFMEYLRMNLARYKFKSYFYFPLWDISKCYQFCEHSPFLNFNYQFAALNTSGKQNLYWFPRILCHSRCTRRFLMNCIMISASKTKWCLAESKEGNNVI